MFRNTLLAVLLLSSCAPRGGASVDVPDPSTALVTDEGRSEPVEVIEELAMDEGRDSEPDDAGQFEPRNWSEVMSFEATLQIGPCGPPGSKAADSMCTWLVRDDGTRWLGTAKEDLKDHDGQRVRVSGRTYEPSPYVAHLGVQHFEVQLVESTKGPSAP